MAKTRKYEVYMESAGGVKHHTVDTFDNERRAVAFCECHGWAWVDENRFEWNLNYREVTA